jgi:hypothetical protein
MELTYDRILDNPDLLSRAVAEAKRERALAINRLVFAPIAAFFRRPKKAVLRHSAGPSLPAACS